MDSGMAVQELRIRLGTHDWAPDGLVCAQCAHVFREGERYTTILHAFWDDGQSEALVVCLSCATGDLPPSPS
jgi:hypothetical protein